MITVVYLPNPFKPSSRILKPFTPEEVKTLADLKEHFKIINPADFAWVINGRQIEHDKIETASLRACDFVAIAPIIRGGGGGGGKNILGVVAGIALMAFTGGAGGGLLGGFLGSQGGMLGLGLALYLGGSLLMGNQKTPQIDSPKFDGAFEGGHGWSVDTIRNVPGSAMPITFGSIRTSGQLLQRQVFGGMVAGEWTQILLLLLAAGEGELDSITDVKVNDIAIASIGGASYEVKLGTNNQTAVDSGAVSTIEQQLFNSGLPMSTTTWVTKSMSEVGQRVIFEFVTPAGGYAVSTENGATLDIELWIRGQYREVGTEVWTDLYTYYPNNETLLAKSRSRKPMYYKETFTPPDASKLYEFRFQNYTLQKYEDTYGWGLTEMPSNYSAAINWMSLRVTSNKVQTFPGTAIVSLRIPASDNLSGGMPKVSWTQTRANILAWNPTTAAYEQKPATNLAWMVYDLIHECRVKYNVQTSANQYVVCGEPKENLDYAAFDAWATYCGEVVDGAARCVGNLLFDSAEQIWPAIQKVASSARGFIIQQAGVFKPVWDAPKTMSQIFTAGNIINGSLKGGFLPEKERATAIEASFLNEENNYERDTLFVPSDDYNPMGLENPTQIYFPGFTDPKIVYRACKHILRKNKYLRRTVSFQADIDSIVAEIGDVVGVQSDITGWGVGGRVMGATTTAVVIDQAVTLSPEGTYTLLIRASDDTLTRKTVDAVLVETTTTTLNFTGEPWSTAPERFSLYAFGANQQETKPFTITGISRNGDLQATISGIEYVGGVYSDDADFPVIDYTAANAAISTLTVNPDADTGRLAISWTIPEDRDYGGAWVYIDGKPYGFIVAEQHDASIDMPPGDYTVTVVPIGGNGRGGGTAVEEEVTLASPTLPAISGVSLSSDFVPQSDGTNLVYVIGTFTIPALATTVLVEIGEGETPGSWSTVQDSRVASIRFGPVKPGTLYTLRFTSRNRYAAGTPVTDTVTTAGDTTAPDAPTVTVNGTLQFMRVLLTLADPPDDLAGFKVYRGTDEIATNAAYVGSVVCQDGTADFIDKVDSYTQIYHYFAKSYDTWRNLGAFSAASAPVQAFKILDADILRQLTPADALNTDPYLQDFSAWSSDLADSAANPNNFVSIADGPAGTTGFKSVAGEKLIFTVDHDALVPYDATRKYVLTAYMRATGGGSHGLGFAYYDASKALIGQSDSLEYGVAADTTWTQFSKTPGSVPSGTAFIGPMVVCNNGTTAGVVLEIQKLRLREVLTSDMLVVNEAVITVAAQIANAVITNAHIANLDAVKITSGTIDTDRFSANFADIRYLSVMGKNLIEDPSLLAFEDAFNPDNSPTYDRSPWEIGGDSYYFPPNGTLGANTPYCAVETHDDQADYVLIGKGLVVAPWSATNRFWLAQKTAVTENVVYAFSVHMLKGWLENAVCPPFQLIIDWYGASGLISQSAGDCDDTEGGRFYIDATAPLGATYAILYVVFPPGTPVTGFYMGVLSALQFERSQDGATFWAPREQGTILADRIFAGILKSLNWSTSAGSLFDLLNGTFKLGGSAAPQLEYDGETLFVRGTLGAADGEIGGFTIGSDSLTAGTGANAIGISTNTDKRAFWAGGTTPTTAPFRVKHDGSAFVGGFSCAVDSWASSATIGDCVYDVQILNPADSATQCGIKSTVYTLPNYFDDYTSIQLDEGKLSGYLIDSDTNDVTYRLGGMANYGGTSGTAAMTFMMSSASNYAIATNGKILGVIENSSDEDIKRNFKEVSTLDKLKAVPVKEWEYDDDAIRRKDYEKAVLEALRTGKPIPILKPEKEKDLPEYRHPQKHVGFMAGDFNTMFGLNGGNSESYVVGDAVGVAFRAIQELAEKQAAEIAELRAMIQELRK